jgi:hypothetical protein
MTGEIVPRESRWTPTGATPARELVRSIRFVLGGTCDRVLAVSDSDGTILARVAYFSCMELIRRASRPRIATWIVACLAGAFSTVAALAYLFYMANGIVAGALIGLPGRETDVAVVQRHAIVWLVACAVFQLGVVIAHFSLLRFGAESDRLVRLASRGLVATFLSCVTTFVAGRAMFEALNLLRPHLR